MNLDEIKKYLDHIFFNSIYCQLLTKNWIYENKYNVLDFEYEKIRFGIDFKIDETEKFKLFLVDRNSYLNFLWKKSYEKSLCIKKGLSIEEIGNCVFHILKEIIDLIDVEFFYKVSVVIPVYNRENLILKCIKSLNNQTLDKSLYEIIFVDDFSSDNTLQAIERNCDSDLNYTILKRPVGSGSASSPRNDGLNKAKGRYVFFLDSDDNLASDCLESVLNFSEDTSADVTYIKIGSDADNPRKSIPIRTFKKGTVEKAKVSSNNLLRSNAVFKYYKRDFLLKNKLCFDLSFPLREDKLFNVQTLSKTKKVAILADKEYIFTTDHDGEHLSQTKHDIFLEVILYLNGYNYIYVSNLDYQHCLELFNAWSIILIERLESIIKSKRVSEKDKELFFYKSLINFHNEIFRMEEKFIYANFRKYIKSINEKDYISFKKLVLEDY